MLWAKALIGVVLVILIQWIAQSRHYYLAVLVPLFPTFTLISHYILGTSRTPPEFKAALLFSICVFFPYMGYNLAVFLSVDLLGLWRSLGVGIVVWMILAMGLVLIWQRIQGQ